MIKIPPVKTIEAVIPAAPKDYSKLEFVIDSVRKYLPDVSDIHLITPDKLENTYGAFHHLDQEVLDIDPGIFTYRPRWIYQQFLKLFQNVTASDWFLVLDADRFFNRPVRLIEDGRPVLLLGHDQYMPHYFEFNKRVLGFGKVYRHSFLSECTLYSQSLVRALLAHCGYTSPREFVIQTAPIICQDCHPAEAELYGDFVMHFYPDVYQIRNLKAELFGKYGGEPWTPAELTGLIKTMQSKNVDIFSAHSWEGSI